MYKPVIIWGAGIRGEEAEVLSFAEQYNIPIVLTWGAIDLLPHNHRLNIGCFGTHGMKAANLAIQNAREVISFGCRLDTKATGTPKDFAPKATIFMIDIDKAEIDKMPKVGREVAGINMSCKQAMERVWKIAETRSDEWLKQCQSWKAEYVPQGPAYDLMRSIGEYTTKEDIIVSDTGNTLGWIMQGFPFKGERFLHAFNFTPMGYGIAAAVGASLASNHRVICIVGDGGALMSINELATINRHNLAVKIILLNNHMHQMCVATQDQWLGGNYYATTEEGGLGFPDWDLIPEAFKIKRSESLEGLFEGNGPEMYIQEIPKDARLAFQVKYGEPIA